MSLFSSQRRVSWPLVSLVIVIAAATWGLYAWRNLDTPFEKAVVSTDDTTAAPFEKPVSLRATRPTPAAVKPEIEDHEELDPAESATPSGSVHVNAPPESAEPVEMTLAKSAVAEPESVGSAVDRAKAEAARGDVVSARKSYSEALQLGLSDAKAAEVRAELTRLSNALLFSRAANTNDPLTTVRVVQPGDTIYAIAKEFGVTEELIMSINGVTEPNRLHVGDRLKVIRGPFRAIISKSDHRMDLYIDDQYIKSFRVGLGVNGGTPTGDWMVISKLRNPDWTDPVSNQYYLAEDPDNPIGERWIGLEGRSGESVGKTGFGIHGTIDPKSIGENMSMGCIRMLANDVAEVFDLLVEHRSQVVINP